MVVRLTLGFVINPLAGLGGRVALKGSDGAQIVDRARQFGAVPRASDRARVALERLLPYRAQLRFLTWGNAMGADLLEPMGFQFEQLGQPNGERSTADDTKAAVQALARAGVDLLLFAGGDGTARNICDSLPEGVPVLGIPAGVKIHSGVYAITPGAAGELIVELLAGKLVDIRGQEVRDIDESAFRQGQVRARHYGELQVPEHGHFVQQVKQGGQEIEELVLQDIADDLTERFEDQGILTCLVGPGSTTLGILDSWGLKGTLLGVDLVESGTLVGTDMSEGDILSAIDNTPVHILVTAIGGQGHIFGRGNQQLSPAVIRRAGIDNILVVASKTKIKALEGRPLVVDTGDSELDRALSGTIRVYTGYRDVVLYPVTSV